MAESGPGESAAERGARERAEIKAIQDRTIQRQLNESGRVGEIARQRHAQAKGASATAAASGRTAESIQTGIKRDTSNVQSFRSTGGVQKTAAELAAELAASNQGTDVGGPFEGQSAATVTRFRDMLARGQFTEANIGPAIQELVKSGAMSMDQAMQVGSMDYNAIRQIGRGGSGTDQATQDLLASLNEQITGLKGTIQDQGDRISNISTSQATSSLPSPPSPAATGNTGIRTQDSKAVESLSAQVKQLIADQQEGFSDEKLRLEQQALVAGLGSDAEAAGRSALENLNVPEFTRSELEGDLESRFRDDIARPGSRDVGVGDVGTELQKQLLARLQSPFEDDAIGAAQRGRFETDASTRREQMIAELSGLGVLRGGGNTVDSFGQFDSGVSQGILDINANTQLRRNEDLTRAQNYAGFESGLGIQNRQLSQQDLNQAVGFEQSQSDRTQRQREFEFGANATRLDMQQNVADRTLARGLTQTDATGRERFEEGVRQAQVGETAARAAASQAQIEENRRYRLDQINQNNQLGITNRELEMQNRQITNQNRQFGQGLTLEQQRVNNQNLQFTAAQSQQNRQFDLSQGQQQGQFSDAQGLERERLRQQNAQYLSTQGADADAIALQNSQFNLSRGDQNRQFQADMAQQGAQFGRQADFSDTQLAQQNQQFLTQNQQTTDARAMQNRQFERELSQQQGQFIDSQGQQARQFGRGANQADAQLAYQEAQLAQQNAQFGLELGQQDRQFGRTMDRGYEQLEEQRAGRVQQANQFASDQAFEGRRLGQQESQFARTLTDAENARLSQGNQYYAGLEEQREGRRQQGTQFGRAQYLAEQQRQDQREQASSQIYNQNRQFEDARSDQNRQFQDNLSQRAGEFGRAQDLAEAQTRGQVFDPTTGQYVETAQARQARRGLDYQGQQVGIQGRQVDSEALRARQEFEATGRRQDTQERRLGEDQQFQQQQQRAALLQMLIGDDQFLKPEDATSTDGKIARKGQLQSQLIDLLRESGIDLTDSGVG